LTCVETRYDFKNTKISSGLNGVNRVFLPTSDVFPTLVASDTNDYISLKTIERTNHKEYKKDFLEKVYFANNYRKITKEETCMIQGFPKDFILPESRARWMKLIGNSVSVPVIDVLIKTIIKTGVFDCLEKENLVRFNNIKKSEVKELAKKFHYRIFIKMQRIWFCHSTRLIWNRIYYQL
jgi:DNA (cytosine-5)-methyltransferase 1